MKVGFEVYKFRAQNLNRHGVSRNTGFKQESRNFAMPEKETASINFAQFSGYIGNNTPMLPKPEGWNSNFMGRKRIGRKDFILSQYQNQISCPCCGEKMHNFDETGARELARSIAEKKGTDLSKVLKENMNDFQASKRELVCELIESAPDFPEKNISQLLGAISGEYIDSLKKKQICVMMDLINELPELHPKDKPLINDWRYQQIKRIMCANEEGEFRNKFLVADFFKMAEKNDIYVDKERIERHFDLLPNSKKDTDAFVIKYMRRSAKETAFNLIKNVEPTIEHIMPFRDSKSNKQSNLLVMCSDCNSSRGSIPYREFLAQHPEMLQNIDLYFSDIEEILHDKMRASKSTRKHYKNYVSNVKETLNRYTQGALDYSPEAEETRRDAMLDIKRIDDKDTPQIYYLKDFEALILEN